jgi:hypothetical protein
MPIQAIFITPGFAVARLGAATAPVDNYNWAEVEEPRYDGETTVVPGWSLSVAPDGSVTPYLPDSISFRDGDVIRPVAPFFEVWARVGANGSDQTAWTEEPLTPQLLQAEGLGESDLQLAITATNRKASRRTGNPNVAFGTATPLLIQGDDHARKVIEGVSPTGAAPPMIPVGRHIPLGSVQIMRSLAQPAGQVWSDEVNVATIRFRFWPAAGEFYGPPDAAVAAPTLGRPVAAVPLANAFLDPAGGWYGVVGATGTVQPGDTYDVINQNSGTTGPSLGVVDDTCEVHFDATLSRAGAELKARAVAFVAPPDFAPDRRPFLSIADELNDRSGDWRDRNAAVSDDELDDWVEDFFERVYETASLLNLDFWRTANAAQLQGGQLGAVDIDGGRRPEPERAMGGNDRLRNSLYPLPASLPNNRLPLTEHARMRHRALSDLQALEALVGLDPDRLKAIIRPPFAVEPGDIGSPGVISTMRMPPFMRQSNGFPLTVAMWQYELLMRWLEKTKQKLLNPNAGFALPGDQSAGPRQLSDSAARRRSAVLRQLDAGN